MAARKAPAKRKPPAKKPAETKENQQLVEPITRKTLKIVLELLDQAPIRGAQARDILEVRAELIEKSEAGQR